MGPTSSSHSLLRARCEPILKDATDRGRLFNMRRAHIKLAGQRHFPLQSGLAVIRKLDRTSIFQEEPLFNEIADGTFGGGSNI